MTKKNEGKRQVVLLVEDDYSVVEVISKQVQDLGYDYVHVSDGELGLTRALDEEFALVVLDLGLPSLGGLEICRKLREKKPLQPIIILTGETGETSTVLGLEIGADEYLNKPVRSMEFRARVRALMRRVENAREHFAEPTSSSKVFELGDLTVNLGLREVRCGPILVEITSTEFDILSLLVTNPDKVFSREQIVSEVWGYASYSSEQNVRTHINRVRAKLEAAGNSPPYIVTQRGYGYRIARDSDRTE